MDTHGCKCGGDEARRAPPGAAVTRGGDVLTRMGFLPPRTPVGALRLDAASQEPIPLPACALQGPPAPLTGGTFVPGQWDKIVHPDDTAPP
jgi:hypothetical protein